jgi:RND family efflux transporter MFP subunit
MPVRPHRVPPAIGAALVLFGTLLLSACGGDNADTAPAPAAPAVTAATVTEREFPRGIEVSGEVAAVEEMQLGVEISGLRITELLVDVGMPVRRGQVLMRLDRRMLESDLAQAEAALREAEAGAALARANLARGQNLAEQRFISATQLDELRAARTQGEARVGTARAVRDTARLRLGFTELRAPDDGVISRLLAQPGQVVMNGGELLRMIRDGRLEWRAELPVAQLATISPGDRVALRGLRGERVEGRVRAVSPGVDQATRTGTVFVDVPATPAVMTGAFLEGRIETGLARAATLPAAAVVQRDGFPTVFVIAANGTVKAQRVRTGLRDGALLELVEGPRPGARVVVRGAGFLADGDRVRVVGEAAAVVDPAATDAGARR